MRDDHFFMKRSGSSGMHVFHLCLSTLAACALITAGCRKSDSQAEVLARVGPRTFTRGELEAAAGIPLDSLPSSTRWRILETWIERTLVDLEGERLKLNEDPDIREKFSALKSDLYRAKLLADNPPPLPDDSVVARYFEDHQKEFLRATDAYLIELYFGEDINKLMEFRQQLSRGDTSMLALQQDVSSEGRWFAESGELDSTLEVELDRMAAGQITMPRPYGDGYRLAVLIEKFPAGTTLNIDAVRDEIVERLLIEEGRRRQEQLVTDLRQRYPVEVMVKDSL